MTDEIYDYFGGNSSRKVEPLDESELFEDEGETTDDADEKKAVEIVESNEVTETIEVVQATQESDGTTTVKEEVVATESHWDELASSFGIDAAVPTPAPASPPPQKNRTSAKKPKAKKKIATKKPSTQAEVVEFGAGLFGPDDTEVVSQQDASPEEDVKPGMDSSSTLDSNTASSEPVVVETETQTPQQSDVDDFFGFDGPAASEGPGEVLSELFVPSPFDAFERPAEASERSATPNDGNTSVEESASPVDAIQISEDGEEFFEFDVEDLVSNPEEKESSRRSRRESSTDRGSRDGRGGRNRSRGTGGRREVRSDEARGRQSDSRSDRSLDDKEEQGDGRRRSSERDSVSEDRNSGRNRNRNRTRGGERGSGPSEADFRESQDGDTQDENSQENRARGRGRSHRNRDEGERDGRGRKPRGERTRRNDRNDQSDYEDRSTSDSEQEQESVRHERGGRSERSGRRGRGGRGRGRGQRSEGKPPTESDHGDEFGVDDSPKRGKVPTWMDAIEGLIDENIDRHQSRSNGGGGGRGRKRRR
ncbi:MAG: hypothetical protein MK106_14605 [Mariniblastus sp.]|nr:hypothetical protein [Mariniblastus sp.]